MNHADHVNLLRGAHLLPGLTWADLGSGAGAFTMALRELIGPDSHIFAVDNDAVRLGELEQAYDARFGNTKNLSEQEADFANGLNLPPLDGALMANSLHFFRNKVKLLRHIGSFLKPGGSLLLVEYDADTGNSWVPFPLSLKTWSALAPQAGFSRPRLLSTHPSRFLHQFYATVSTLL